MFRWISSLISNGKTLFFFWDTVYFPLIIFANLLNLWLGPLLFPFKDFCQFVNSLVGSLTIENRFWIVGGGGRRLFRNRPTTFEGLLALMTDKPKLATLHGQLSRTNLPEWTWGKLVLNQLPLSFRTLWLYWATKPYFLTLGRSSTLGKVSDRTITDIWSEIESCLESLCFIFGSRILDVKGVPKNNFTEYRWSLVGLSRIKCAPKSMGKLGPTILNFSWDF